jgi:3-dehydroquinate synthase
MEKEFIFSFGGKSSRILIDRELPGPEKIAAGLGLDKSGAALPFLIVCDANTRPLVRTMLAGASNPKNRELPVLTLPAGEETKNWGSVETILAAAKKAGLGRDGVFVGLGGGVISDITAFAASIYMRGALLALVSTTLLGMVDAAVGGKTGIDLLGMKNLAGTFYPAGLVYMPLDSLRSLPEREWKSGMAELIKTALLDTGDMFSVLDRQIPPPGDADPGGLPRTPGLSSVLSAGPGALAGRVSRSVSIKGRIVEADPGETGRRRMLLNLGHTFGHALEASAGLGALSHGEAVAWGLARSAELGAALGLCPRARAGEIIALLTRCAYETRAPHPLAPDLGRYMVARGGDKKKRNGKLIFLLTAEQGAVLYQLEEAEPLKEILQGEHRL